MAFMFWAFIFASFKFLYFHSGISFFFKLGTIPTDLEQATGVERKELEAILSGNPVGIVFMIINLYFYD